MIVIEMDIVTILKVYAIVSLVILVKTVHLRSVLMTVTRGETVSRDSVNVDLNTMESVVSIEHVSIIVITMVNAMKMDYVYVIQDIQDQIVVSRWLVRLLRLVLMDVQSTVFSNAIIERSVVYSSVERSVN